MAHIKIEKVEEKAKTSVFEVSSNHDGTVLGKIFWHGPWRQYVFEPMRLYGTVWSSDCLKELEGFLEVENAKHRALLNLRRL